MENVIYIYNIYILNWHIRLKFMRISILYSASIPLSRGWYVILHTYPFVFLIIHSTTIF